MDKQTLEKLEKRAAEVGCSVDALVDRLLNAERSDTSNLFHRLLLSTSDIITLFDLEYRHVFVSPIIETFTGIPAAEILGKTNRELGLPTDLVELWESTQRRLIETRQDQTIRFDFTFEGQRRYFESIVSPLLADNGDVEYILSITRDIQMRNQYEELQARMAAIVESSADAIISKSLDGTILSWNPSAERLFGYSTSEAVGQPITILFPPVSMDEEVSILEQIRGGRRIEHFETMRLHKDGHSIPVSVTISPIYDSVGRVVAASKIVRDITERLRVEQQQRDYEKTLEKERVRFLSEFIEGASHECRTPLTIINTSAYIIARRDDPATRRDKVQQITDQVSRINRLVGMLLKRVALEANEAEFTQVDLALLLRELRLVVDRTPLTNTAPVSWEVSGNLPLVEGSASQIADALFQLIDNARNNTPAHGQITVTASLHDEQVFIEVADTGVGISEEDLPHIFKSFWRSDKARTTAGFGLGLPIALKLVELNRGRIEVQSQPGRGSIFRIVLPAGKPG